ncbi:F-box domain protein [Penicillium argentinense]|uniref:F-box domain protein n=1 Tax=Penicillium argentinense TaxID=1131581 RepID=A0A9W9EPQ7_9EURO|nr:F-box domain protein [Penicillium argentinense]KAJ5085586.1 F-box domain protein [Penicillium argentinense]
MTSPGRSLSTLPEEILSQILDQSTLNGTTLHAGVQHPKRVYSELRALALVCRRIHRLVTPLLFEGITFYHEYVCPSCIKDRSIVPPCRRALALHRVLRDNPPLRAKCLSLDIIIDDTADTSDEDFQVANDLITWLTRTRSLRFYGGFHEGVSEGQRANALALIRNASKGMVQLKEFLLDGDEFNSRGLSLAEAMENISFPSLEVLAMISNGPSDPADLRRMLSSKKSRGAPFTSLTLKYCKDLPEAIEQFVYWPKQLVDFTVNTSGNKLVSRVSLRDAQKWLSIHKDTLKYLYIDLLGHDQGLHFDASIFSRLEALRLSRTQLNDEDDRWNNDLRWEPSHADRVLSPKLQTFGMSFGIMGCCLINNFGDKEVNWLRCLGKAAASKRSALDTIEILFNPLSAYPHKYGAYPEDYGYPWDRISGLQAELARYGIDLVYNSPPWTKEEWEAMISRWLSESVAVGS